MHKRARWYQAEQIVIEAYIARWWQLLHKNYTIQWWEIDCIFFYKDALVFIEVKDVSFVEDINSYITQKKRINIKKAIQHYLYDNRIAKPLYTRLQCDIVFIKNKKIYTVIENCVDF